MYEFDEVKKKLKAIYQQGGVPEYADLALNPYSGCSHRCWYCFNKYYWRNPYDKPSKTASLKNIQHDLEILQNANYQRPVLISDMGDAYDKNRNDNSHMREVLKLFREYDHPFRVLTKGGMSAVKDFDLYGQNDFFGVTLTCDNDVDSMQNEPNAALPEERIESLRIAHDLGVKTWVSCEPVLIPAQTLHLIELTNEFVNLFWVGKLNKRRAEKGIDWPKFRADVEALLQRLGKQPGIGYRLKHQLREAK